MLRVYVWLIVRHFSLLELCLDPLFDFFLFLGLRGPADIQARPFLSNGKIVMRDSPSLSFFLIGNLRVAECFKGSPNTFH